MKLANMDILGKNSHTCYSAAPIHAYQISVNSHRFFQKECKSLLSINSLTLVFIIYFKSENDDRFYCFASQKLQ